VLVCHVPAEVNHIIVILCVSIAKAHVTLKLILLTVAYKSKLFSSSLSGTLLKVFLKHLKTLTLYLSESGL